MGPQLTSHPLSYPRDALALGFELAQFAQEEVGVLVDNAFFASLEREEGRPAAFRIAYHPAGVVALESLQEQVSLGNAEGAIPAWCTIGFEVTPAVGSFSVHNLVKASSMTRLPRTAIIVGRHEAALRIEGLGRRIPRGHARVEAEANVLVCTSTRPGQVILSVHGYPVFWYESGRRLATRDKQTLWELLHHERSVVRGALLAICAESLAQKPFAVTHHDQYYLIAQTLEEVVQTMTNAHHGGLVGILPPAHRDKVRDRGKYRVAYPSGQLLRIRMTDVVVRDADERGRRTVESRPRDGFPLEDSAAATYSRSSRDDLSELAQNIGMLTTVDNALLLGPDLEIVSAGYQVTQREPAPRVREVSTLDASGQLKDFPLERHGSRHRAAADFATSFPGAVVLLLSQDGAVRCFLRPQDQDANEVWLWNILAPIDL